MYVLFNALVNAVSTSCCITFSDGMINELESMWKEAVMIAEIRTEDLPNTKQEY
jgi:thiamine monophosphate kinase